MSLGRIGEELDQVVPLLVTALKTVNYIAGPGPFDRIRFLFGDQNVNPEKFAFELVITSKAEWEP